MTISRLSGKLLLDNLGEEHPPSENEYGLKNSTPTLCNDTEKSFQLRRY